VKRKNISNNNTIIYNNVDLKLTSDQIFDLRTQLGITTQKCLEMRYNEIIQKIREEKLEFLTD